MAVLDRGLAHEALPIVPDLNAPQTPPKAAFYRLGSVEPHDAAAHTGRERPWTAVSGLNPMTTSSRDAKS